MHNQAQTSRLRPTAGAQVVWEDEVARDGGVKRALDNLLETSLSSSPLLSSPLLSLRSLSASLPPCFAAAGPS